MVSLAFSPMRVDLVAAESRRFFHVHLQKTGGTTLALQLRRLFGENATYPNPTDGADYDVRELSGRRAG
jgi:hypothetical protein